MIALAAPSFNYGRIDRAKARTKQRIRTRYPELAKRFHRIGLPPKVFFFENLLKVGEILVFANFLLKSSIELTLLLEQFQNFAILLRFALRADMHLSCLLYFKVHKLLHVPCATKCDTLLIAVDIFLPVTLGDRLNQSSSLGTKVDILFFFSPLYSIGAKLK